MSRWGIEVKNDYEVFEEAAVPHSWLMVANELNEQAEACFERKGQSRIHQFGSTPEEHIATIDQANRAAFLLGGFALENMIKSYLVYENPKWIANGSLSNELTTRGHELSQLARKSKTLPWPKKGEPVLVAFESGLSSWARYPCPRRIAELRSPRYFTDELWGKYRTLFQRYDSKMKLLLGRNWQGPHSFQGHYKFDGDF